MTDLFSPDSEDSPSQSSSTQNGQQRHTPLAVRMRPRELDEVVGQKHVLQAGSPLRVLAEGTSGPAQPSSVILWGPPGTGKTTLAHVIARGNSRKFVELSAIRAGIKDVRQVMDQALEDRDLRRITTVLFLDEIHRFNKAQQDALLPGVENGWVILMAATTENPSFSVISPLLSRSLLVTLEPLHREDLSDLVDRALNSHRGLNGHFTISSEAKEHLLKVAGGDARRVLTALEAAAAVTDAAGQTNIGTDSVEQAMNQAIQRYDKNGDQHYDVISAFIKSLRGSDPDAALHYLARMLEAGEDPKFIARRLVIAASEEVSMADPSALTVAVSAAQAVQLVGLPEGRIALAQATVHIATAPKSNASYKALDQAIAEVRQGKAGSVPPHLRDAHYKGAHRLGHGQDYVYAHDQPHHIASQQYPPDELIGRDYYQPTSNGAERAIAERLEKIRAIVRKNP